MFTAGQSNGHSAEAQAGHRAEHASVATAFRGRDPLPGQAPIRVPHEGEVERRRVGALAIIAHDLKAPLANLDLLLGALAVENAKAAPDRRTGLTLRAERVV